MQRGRRRVTRHVFTVVLLVASLALVARAALYRTYPLHHWQSVSNRALDHGLDPLFVAAVIRVESGWDAAAKSGPGALGLMQVMPETGREVADRLQISGFQPEHLHEPDVNIRIGTFYLAALQREFDGNQAAALAAYNGGIGHVRSWLKAGRWTGHETSVEQIPFPETREFVQRVGRDYRWYLRLYHPDGTRRW